MYIYIYINIYNNVIYITPIHSFTQKMPRSLVDLGKRLNIDTFLTDQITKSF